jgi:DNA-binding transcriptional MerR regulator
MAHYSIKDLEKMSGIQAHTIRIWEKRYKMIIPKRTDTNIRTYSDDNLKMLLNIALLNRNGLKISKIAKLTPEEMEQWIMKLSSDPTHYDSQIEAMVAATIEINEPKLVAIFDDLESKLGLEDTITKVVYPFMRKTGALWLTSKVNSAQEHFVSNIMRRKIFAAIDKLETQPNGLKFLIFLPDGEYHEIGMLFFMYLLKKKGYNPIYLGPSVPMYDLIDIQQKLNADYLVTAFITRLQDFSFSEYTLKLSKTFKKTKILLTGEIASRLELKRIPNINIIKSAEDFKVYLSKIK